MSLVGLGNQTSTTWTANVPHKEEGAAASVPCAKMCHDVPCIAEPGATSLPLGLFARGLWRGEWEEPKSQVMSALTRPWHGLDVMWTSTEKVKQKESQNYIHSPRIWGAHLQVSHGKTFGECVDFWWFLYGQHSAESLDLWTTFGLHFWIFLCSFCEAKWRELGTPWDTQRHWRRLPVLAHWKATWPKRSFRSRPLPITWYILIPFLRLFPKC